VSRGHLEVVGDRVVLGETVQFGHLDIREATERRLQVPLDGLAPLERALQAAVSDRVRADTDPC